MTQPNQTQPDWTAAPACATHWCPRNKRFYITRNGQHFAYAEGPDGKWVISPKEWIDQLIARPQIKPQGLQQFAQYRLSEAEYLLSVENQPVVLVAPANTVVTYGGPGRFNPEWHEVASIHYVGEQGTGYVGITPMANLLPLETAAEREAKEQIRAMCNVLECKPGSIYGELIHKLHAAGCRMPLDKIKE